ncbi:MAG: glycosyltransferase family 9 protein [Candidatus Accumulibacter sp. UW20]
MSSTAPPRVSCLMPTRNRHAMLPAAVANFLAQDFADAELLIVSEDGVPDSLDAALATGRVRHLPCPAGLSLGAKRNFACQAAHADLLAHWDDDDRYPRDRLSRQVNALLAQTGKALCGSSRVHFRELEGERAWEYRYQGSRQPWLCGATLLFRRDYWQRHRFPDQTIGEDNHFVWSAQPAEVLDLDDPSLCIAGVHAGNSSRKETGNAWWTPIPRARIDALLAGQALTPVRLLRPRAVLVLAGGLGDVLRWASLVPVLDAAGYGVELLIAADYPDIVALFDGAPGVDRVRRGDPAQPRWLDADEAAPALAIFAYWALGLTDRLPAGRQLGADRQRWPLIGDPGCIVAIARELGWQAPLPVPPLAPSLRAGEAAVAGTLAIHAGCKAGWPWKKWHGHGELARHFARVLRVGTAADEDASGTYFATPIDWPAHVEDATAPRTLADSARLIAACSAMVANDSGLMHLAAALGVPTLGIFGLTSPAREAMPWPALHPLSGGLACETACRSEPWGRRDCLQHLQCLKTLDPARVAARLLQLAPTLAPAAKPSARPASESPAASHSAPAVVAASRSPAPVELAIKLGGGFGDLLLAGRLLDRLWPLAGHGEITAYGERPELVQQALGGRGLIRSAPRPLREWSSASGLRVEITQFVRFFALPEGWRQTHPELAALIARSNRRIASVRGLVDRHPQLDGFWARFNQAAGRGRAGSLAWSAGFESESDDDPGGLPGVLPGTLPGQGDGRRAVPEATLCVPLDDADAGPRLRLAALGRRWMTVHDGFDTGSHIRPGEAVKCWPLAHWTELIRRLKAAHPALRIVQIGGASSRSIPGVDDCLIGTLRLGEALWLLKGSLLHIDGESGLVHAAHGLATPAVVLFGPTAAGFFAYPGNTNLDAKVCVPCWWSTPDWLGRCPRGLAEPVCMSAISPAVVCDATLSRLERCQLAATPTLEVLCRAVWSPTPNAGTARVAAIREHAGLVTDPDGHARSPATGCHLHATKHWEYAFALDALGSGTAADGDRRLRIADLGCGRGALGPWLAAQGHAVTGYERNFAWDGNADAARRFLAWAPASGFQPQAATLYALPVADTEAGFDAVLMISVLQHLAQPELALREAARILKPGGRLVLTFDLADEPAHFEDALRRTVVSPARLARWLDCASVDLDPAAVRQSASELQMARVAGMPPGLTVGGIVLRRQD